MFLVLASIAPLLSVMRHCIAKFESFSIVLAFFRFEKTSFVAVMELSPFPKASSFNLNKVVFCLHYPFK